VGTEDSYEQEALSNNGGLLRTLFVQIMSSDRFDLLGNSLAILTGIALPQSATNMLT